jgi:hypothetical protein
MEEIDLVITGRNGDVRGDIYYQLEGTIFKNKGLINYTFVRRICHFHFLRLMACCQYIKSGIVPGLPVPGI